MKRMDIFFNESQYSLQVLALNIQSSNDTLTQSHDLFVATLKLLQMSGDYQFCVEDTP